MALSQVPVTLDLYSWQTGFLFIYLPRTLWQKKNKFCVTDRSFVLCTLIRVSWMRSGLFPPLLLSESKHGRGYHSGELASTNVGLVTASSWNPLDFSLKLTGKCERGLPALDTGHWTLSRTNLSSSRKAVGGVYLINICYFEVTADSPLTQVTTCLMTRSAIIQAKWEGDI